VKENRTVLPSTRAAITAALASIEETGQRQGWDLPPVLFGLFDHLPSGESRALEVDDTLAGPTWWNIPDPTNCGENLPVSVALHRFARDLTAPVAQAWLRRWLHHDGRTCVGVGILFEAWAGLVSPGYRHGDLATSATRREVRVAVAVDTGLGLHRVVRARGGQPSVASWPELPAPARHRRIVTGLRSLIDLARTS
jgi:hypothetical protein